MMKSIACTIALSMLLFTEAVPASIRSGKEQSQQLHKEEQQHRSLSEILIPLLPIQQVALVVAQQIDASLIIDTDALTALQLTCQDYVVDVYADAMLVADNAKRSTVEPDDVNVALIIRGEVPSSRRRRLIDYEASGASGAKVLDLARIDYDADGAGNATELDSARVDSPSTKDPLDAISKKVLRDLAKRVGAKHVSGKVVEKSRVFLRAFLESVVRDAAQHTLNDGRLNITAEDITYALSSRRPICADRVYARKGSKSSKGS